MTSNSAASGRLPALAEPLDPDTQHLLDRLPHGADGPIHLMAVLAHHPRLLRAWSRFTGSLLSGALSPGDRERLILRTAWNTQSSYEWGHHVGVARTIGLTDEEILACAGSIKACAPADRLLFQVADEVHTRGEVSKETLGALTRERSAHDAVEVVLMVGVYRLTDCLVRSLDVLDDPGLPPLGRVE